MAKAWGDFTSFLNGEGSGGSIGRSAGSQTKSGGTVGRTAGASAKETSTSSSSSSSKSKTKKVPSSSSSSSASSSSISSSTSTTTSSRKGGSAIRSTPTPTPTPTPTTTVPTSTAPTSRGGGGGSIFGGMIQDFQDWMAEDDPKLTKSVSAPTVTSTTNRKPTRPPAVDRVGFLITKVGEKDVWKTQYCVLISGSFYIYGDPREQIPRFSYSSLSLLKVKSFIGKKASSSSSSTTSKPAAEKYILKLEVRKNPSTTTPTPSNIEDCYFIFPSKTMWEDWVETLKENQKLPPCSPPKSTSSPSLSSLETDSTGTKKMALFDKMKEGIASSAASSALGKKTIRAALNEEGSAIFESLMGITKRQYGSKVGGELESWALKIGVKVLMLMEREGANSGSSFSIMKPVERYLFDALDLLLDAYRIKDKRKHLHLIPDALKAFRKAAKKVEAVFTHIVAPYFDMKELERVAWISEHVTNLKALEQIFSDPDHTEDLVILCESLMETD